MSTHPATPADAVGGSTIACPGGRTPKAPHTLLLSRTSVTAAWLVLALAAFHPPHGLAVPLCLFRATTGAPCWGCGLSRSVSCSLRGMLAEAWAYHPFGPIVATLFAGIAITSVLSVRRRSRVAMLLDRNPRVTVSSYSGFVALFVTFGTLRALFHLL